jgi:hypothetical protein
VILENGMVDTSFRRTHLARKDLQGLIILKEPVLINGYPTMRVSRHVVLLILALAIGGGLLLHCRPSADTVEGQVRDATGPVSRATLRLQGKFHSVLSDDNGRFVLPKPDENGTPVVAWKEGYRIGSVSFRNRPLDLFLTRLPTTDNDNYNWIDPAPAAGKENNCGNCHETIYQEWRKSGHARSAQNPRFLALYDGGAEKTWNLRQQHPVGAGVCAACHAPTFSDTTLEYDLIKVTGIAARGVHCDYCHKVADAPTDKLGTRFGRDGLKLLRPAQNDLLTFGPLQDAVRPGESFAYSPLYKESRYCASCHEGVIFGVHVYGTYSEWRDSPAAKKGQECQTCHMAPTGKMSNIAPGKGGIERDPKTLGSHGFPGGQADMLRRCLDVEVTFAEQGKGMAAAVEVSVKNVGHRVPTGFIDRNLVLVVEGFGKDGERLKVVSGPRLPAAAGKKLAGLPGKLFAKKLQGPDGAGPIPFWLPHGEMADTRLYPDRTEQLSFVFPVPMDKIRVRLLYRRFWPEVADPRGWIDNEIVVLDRVISNRLR